MKINLKKSYANIVMLYWSLCGIVRFDFFGGTGSFRLTFGFLMALMVVFARAPMILIEGNGIISNKLGTLFKQVLFFLILVVVSCFFR